MVSAPNGGNTALRVRGLSVYGRDGRPLLREVNLDVAGGERVLVVGASGSGKSTLLRLIAGLSPAPGTRVEGSIRVLDLEVLRRDPAADPLPIGWLPQDPAAAVCLPRVGDDVAFGCESHRFEVEQIDRAVDEALHLVGAQGWHECDTGTLSAGQAQRVGLAGATAPTPALLLLDEPTAMLDPQALRRVRTALARLAANKQPPALLLVEHRLDEWADGAELPGRVIVLDRGAVIADGPAARVWSEHGAAMVAAGCHLPWPVERATIGVATTRRDGFLAVNPPPARSADRGSGAELLRASGLAVGHGSSAVLTDLALTVRAGEVVAVIGANGAGKTTLLHTLAGVRRPLAGTVRRPAGRPALIFQSPEQQFLAQTVAEELAFDGATSEQVRHALAELRLEATARLTVHRLSGGEQRRLSVGTVLLARRPLVLADEPTFGLDRDGVVWTTRAFRAAAAQGRGVLLTSHDLRFVLEVADRVLVVHGGRVLAEGPCAEVLADPLLQAAGLTLPASVRHVLAAGQQEAPQPTEPPRHVEALRPVTLLGRLNPLTGLALATVFGVMVSFLFAPLPLLVLHVLLLVLLVAVGAGVARLVLTQLALLPFALGVLLTNAISRPGLGVARLGPLTVTDHGLEVGAALAIRVLLVAVPAVAVTSATDPTRLIASARQHLGLSAAAGFAILTAQRMLASMPQQWSMLVAAGRSRAPLNRRGRPILGLRGHGRAAFGLLVAGIRRGERIADALQVRGLRSSDRTIRTTVPFGRADLVAVVLTVLLCTVALIIGSLAG